ncbi:hypothetical protein FWJ25_04735 [Marinobacter salinexigens]|uniref:Polysaccharide chain length determinant N-terminal domain-containing protein n=1 Tax=Marinobacter salinexigens TaxID=2919747 RepID=A0A5B0VIY6_9GAMM|nr:Wzz/FepE/Etk N-terminal domain-containing protein [Marinobacter salinexigens]KAA1174700.1 hypothetical protein FWJ25_04735 [Marinobacter salinexigens]
MNQERDQSYSEISLVDLATIFVRRIWLFVVVLGVFVAAGIAVALLQPEQYAYVSLYQIAEKATEEPVETPERVIAVLQSHELPLLETSYKSERGERLPFSVRFSNPEGTSLVRISSEAERRIASDVKAIHSALIQRLSEKDNRLMGVIRGGLENRIASVSTTLDSLSKAPEAGQAVAEAIRQKVELEGILDALKPGESVVVARESVEKVAPNRKLIAILTVVLGFVAAFVAVYFAEFASLVREKLKEQKAR